MVSIMMMINKKNLIQENVSIYFNCRRGERKEKRFVCWCEMS